MSCRRLRLCSEICRRIDSRLHLNDRLKSRAIDEGDRAPQPYAGADGVQSYQQVLKGLPAVNYAARDIIYRPRNVRPHRVYGYSPVQQILMTVNIALRRQLWQLDYYAEGSIPDALIGVPQGWTPDQIKQFQDYWDQEFSGDLARRRRLNENHSAVSADRRRAGFASGDSAADRAMSSCCFSRRRMPRPGDRDAGYALANDLS